MNYTYNMGSYRKQGFTLVEMSVVLTVIALVTAMGISGGMDILESTRRVATESKLDEIEKALTTYRKKFGRLPCPGRSQLLETDSNYGVEAPNNNGRCTGGAFDAQISVNSTTYKAVSGSIPTATLGMPPEFMYDGWGRKFDYVMTPDLAQENGFAMSQPGDECSISVGAHSGSNLAMRAAYGLISHGRNGYGAWLKSGGQMASGSGAAVEYNNIPTSAMTAGAVVYRFSRQGATDANNYDDIVRWKYRYQMLDTIDRTTPLYGGPDFLLSVNATSSHVFYGKRACGQYRAFTGTTPAAYAATVRYAGYTADNRNIFLYHDGECRVYSITNNVVANSSASNPVTPGSCPSGSTITGAMAIRNSQLLLSYTAAPYARLHALMSPGAGAYYRDTLTKFDPVLASQPQTLSLSGNAEYATAARYSATTYGRLFKRSGDVFREIALPSDAYSESNNAISPNGKYYAIAVVSGGSTNIYIWRNVSGTFSQILTGGGSALLYTVTNMTVPSSMKWSADSKYLAIGGTSTGNNLAVLYVDPLSESVGAALTQALAATPASFDFSANADALIVSRGQAGTSSINIYRRNGTAFYSTPETLSGTFSFNGAANSIWVATSR